MRLRHNINIKPAQQEGNAAQFVAPGLAFPVLRAAPERGELRLSRASASTSESPSHPT